MFRMEPRYWNTGGSFQELITALQQYWMKQGCAILQPYDLMMGAGTFHPATTLRALGPKAWNVAYVQPCRRPTDGRYGDSPNRLQHFHQFQVVMKPAPKDIRALYLGSLEALGLDLAKHDIRFVEDDWESPTLGAKGLGWECWCDGMEISQFTYFQQICGIECRPVSVEITYGLERLAMYLQGVDNVYELCYAPGVQVGGAVKGKLSYGDIFLEAEEEYSRFNFEGEDSTLFFDLFETADEECRSALQAETRQVMPAYDCCIRASHILNILDARGAISATDKQNYILRIREMASACGRAYLEGSWGEEITKDEREEQEEISW